MATKRSYYTEEVGTIVADYLRRVCNTKSALEFYPENYGLTLGSLKMMLYNGACYAAEHLGCKDEWDSCSIEKRQKDVRISYVGKGHRLGKLTPELVNDDREKIRQLREGPAGVKLTLPGPITVTRRARLNQALLELPQTDYVYVVKPNQAVIIKIRDECRDTTTDVSGSTGETDRRGTEEDLPAVSESDTQEPGPETGESS